MTPATAPSLYGLLYVGGQRDPHANLARGGEGALAIYAANAVTLARSAQAQGQSFTLVTNSVARVEAALTECGLQGAVVLREHTFTLDVPEGVPFRSAHFKLDLVRAFAGGEFGAFPALVDLDAVLLRPLELPDKGALWAYDTSTQMWGETPDPRALASLSVLAGFEPQHPRWYGGEFLAGPAARFAELWQEIEAIWPAYVAQVNTIYHAGDEMALAAALARLDHRGSGPCDAGGAGLVCRWWSRRTTNPMPSLDHAMSCAVAHLPADKEWLAERAGEAFEATRFAAAYRHRAAARLPAERAKSLAERLLGRPAYHAPQLA